MRYERFRDAFLALVDTSGVSFQDVAERSGLPYDRIYNIKKRPDASTHVETAMAIARSFGMTIEQLMNGDASTPTDLNFVQIPRYRASFSAGGGTQNEAAKMVDFLPFTREFIAGKLGRRSVDGLVIAEVNGESMNPTLSNGDLVMLDTIQRQKPSGLYAIELGEDLLVKRVEHFDSGYTLLSDNQSYPPRYISGDDLERLRFVGRVVWVGRVL